MTYLHVAIRYVFTRRYGHNSARNSARGSVLISRRKENLLKLWRTRLNYTARRRNGGIVRATR